MTLTIYLDDHRRRLANWIGKLQHVCAGVPLLLVGLNKLIHDEAERPMAAIEVAIAMGVFVAFLQELRAERRHAAGHAEGASHPKLGWFDLAAGALLIFEAFHGSHHKPGYMRPPFYSGLATLALGLFHHRIQSFHHRRRYIKLDDAGLEFRSSRFRRLKLRWDELVSIDLNETRIVFHRTDGRRHSIRLGWFRNADALRRAVADHPGAAALLAEPEPRLH